MLLFDNFKIKRKSSAAQEREAYADAEYIEVLHALRDAVEKEEEMRWRIVAAQARIECWITIESTRRMETKIL